MGSPPPESQPPGQRPVVAFDFDGTLTTRDSFTAFLAWLAGPARGIPGLLRLAPALAAYAAKPDRGRLKAAAIKEFLAGMTPAELAQRAESFAEAEAARLLRPDAVQAWSRWRDGGALMVIVTASPEAVVAPFARRLGADLLIGTRLQLDARGRIDGALLGANCRGPEKVERLRSQFGAGLVLAAAYGDTAGDREMLEMATVRGYRVFKRKPSAHSARPDEAN
jgi:phosphatidylglycerophosphatase C